MENPGVLYKYRSFNEQNSCHVEDIFVNNRIYFPSPKEFNDPFDCSVKLSMEGTDEEWREYILGCLERERPGLSPLRREQVVQEAISSGRCRRLDPQIIAGVTHTLGVYCLSAVKDDMLMWSHYSGGHTGIVLEFQAGPSNLPFGRAYKVDYQWEYPRIRIFDTYEARLKATVLTKSKHWVYEQEYRAIEQNGRRLYPFPDRLLTGVICGCRMREERKAKIREWISGRSTKPVIYQARQKDHEFGLNIEEPR